MMLLAELAPSPARLGKAPFVLYYPASSGYFTIARHEAPEVGPFLHTYEARVAGGDVLHVGTHPPGLFLVFHSLGAAVDQWPLLRDLALATMPASFHDACELVTENTAQTPHPMTRHEAAILWLATLLVISLAAATCIPLYFLTVQYASARTAWLTAALWPLVPAVTIFIPKSDAAFPFLSMSLICGIAWLCRSRNHFTRMWQLLGGLAWGGLAALSMLQTLAFAPILLMAFLYGAWTGGLSLSQSLDDDGRQATRRNAIAAIAIIAGFVGSIELFHFFNGANLWQIWWQNSLNHSRFYEVSPRSTWLWFLVAPLELMIAAGWPVFLRAWAPLTGMPGTEAGDLWHPGSVSTAGSKWTRIVMSLGERSRTGDGERLAICCLSVWIWLWLSGKNSGEVARLWIFLMPLLLWLPVVLVSRSEQENQAKPLEGEQTPKSQAEAGLWLTAQMIACVLTVWRVSGFDFGGGVFDS
ncbi:MAG: hypothetical protein C0478_15825 [Planctomyces sp.]|nr:hypothetical protein [Planctomyces sp.]